MKARRNLPQRVQLPFLLGFFPLSSATFLVLFSRTEVICTTCSVGSKGLTTRLLEREDVWFKSVWVDELSKATMSSKPWLAITEGRMERGPYIGVHVIWKWMDVWREFNLSWSCEQPGTRLVELALVPTGFGTRKLGDWISGT